MESQIASCDLARNQGFMPHDGLVRIAPMACHWVLGRTLFAALDVLEGQGYWPMYPAPQEFGASALRRSNLRPANDPVTHVTLLRVVQGELESLTSPSAQTRPSCLRTMLCTVAKPPCGSLELGGLRGDVGRCRRACSQRPCQSLRRCRVRNMHDGRPSTWLRIRCAPFAS